MARQIQVETSLKYPTDIKFSVIKQRTAQKSK